MPNPTREQIRRAAMQEQEINDVMNSLNNSGELSARQIEKIEFHGQHLNNKKFLSADEVFLLNAINERKANDWKPLFK